MQNKFKCINCGHCCSNAKNLALFEWEKDELQGMEGQIDIIPGHKIRYKNTDIILYWGLCSKQNGESKPKNSSKNSKQESSNCPFLSFDYGCSKCRIYPRRPLVCRAFPIFHLGFNSQEEMVSVDCPEHIIPFEEGQKLSKREFYLLLYRAYGNTFVDAFRLELARVWVSDLAESVINYLEDNDIELSESEIGLLELASNLGILEEEEIRNEIDFIYSDDVLGMFRESSFEPKKKEET